MKTKYRSASLQTTFALVLGLAAPEVCFANDGFYLGLEGGINFLNGQTARETGSANGTPVVSTKFDLGSVAGLTAGYGFESGWRPELEFGYRRNDPRKISTDYFVVDGTRNLVGHNDAFTGFGNLWYDFKVRGGLFSKLHPYVGGGVGAARLAIRRNRYNDRAGSRIDHDGYDTTFGWQLGTGVGLDVSRHVTVGLDYRFLQTNHNKNLVVEVDNRVLTRDTIYSRYRAHSVLVNARFTFGGGGKRKPVTQISPVAFEATPAPTAPPPAPTPPTVVMLRTVNFVFDHDDLTDAAKITLNEVAAALKQQPGLPVSIVGHTDSLGSEAYNIALSQRRASAVMRYLVSQGVDRSTLATSGLGENNPIASNNTDEGRAENRRVEFTVTSTGENLRVQSSPSTPESKAAARVDDAGTKAGTRKRRSRN